MPLVALSVITTLLITSACDDPCACGTTGCAEARKIKCDPRTSPNTFEETRAASRAVFSAKYHGICDLDLTDECAAVHTFDKTNPLDVALQCELHGAIPTPAVIATAALQAAVWLPLVLFFSQ